jgi:hypothetical protein
MTAKQKAAREKFKKVVAEAGKLRKKNPSLTQAQAVKQAFAISYSKGGEVKKVGAVKKKYTQKQLEKIADDYAYITEGDVDKITYRLLDKDYTDKLLPIYLDKIAEYNKKNKKVGSIKKKAATKKKIGNTSGILIQFNPRLKTWAVYENGEYQGNWKTLKNAKDWVKAYFGEEANKIDKTGYMPKTKKVGAVKKKAAPKKVASKRITDIHKDSKSHNVNIKVVSGFVGRLIVKTFTLSELKKMNPVYFEKGKDAAAGIYKRKLITSKKLNSQVMVEAKKEPFTNTRSYSIRLINPEGSIGMPKKFDTIYGAAEYIGKNIIL